MEEEQKAFKERYAKAGKEIFIFNKSKGAEKKNLTITDEKDNEIQVEEKTDEKDNEI